MKPGPAAPLLRAEGLSLRHAGQPALFADLNLELRPGEVLGLLGPSGSGKSSLARCLAGLQVPTAGRIWFQGQVLGLPRSRAQRQAIQYVWQEPLLALNPYRSALQSALEPLEGFGMGGNPEQRRAQTGQMLQRLGLPASAWQSRPHQLSGGQCQRVVLARALLAEPELLLLDEPFSALDNVSSVALIEDLAQLLAQRRLTLLLVSHDPALLRRLATRSAVLEGGRWREFQASAQPPCSGPHMPA